MATTETWPWRNDVYAWIPSKLRQELANGWASADDWREASRSDPSPLLGHYCYLLVLHDETYLDQRYAYGRFVYGGRHRGWIVDGRRNVHPVTWDYNRGWAETDKAGRALAEIAPILARAAHPLVERANRYLAGEPGDDGVHTHFDLPVGSEGSGVRADEAWIAERTASLLGDRAGLSSERGSLDVRSTLPQLPPSLVADAVRTDDPEVAPARDQVDADPAEDAGDVHHLADPESGERQPANQDGGRPDPDGPAVHLDAAGSPAGVEASEPGRNLPALQEAAPAGRVGHDHAGTPALAAGEDVPQTDQRRGARASRSARTPLQALQAILCDDCIVELLKEGHYLWNGGCIFHDGRDIYTYDQAEIERLSGELKVANDTIAEMTHDGVCIPVDVDIRGFEKFTVHGAPVTSSMDDYKMHLLRMVLRPDNTYTEVHLNGGRMIRVAAWANRSGIGPECAHEARASKREAEFDKTYYYMDTERRIANDRVWELQTAYRDLAVVTHSKLHEDVVGPGEKSYSFNECPAVICTNVRKTLYAEPKKFMTYEQSIGEAPLDVPS